MKKLTGKLTITSPHGLDGSYISIKLVDENSYKEAVTIKIDHETFSKLLTGQGFMEVEYEIIENIGLLGKIKEVKDIAVNVEGLHELDDKPALFKNFMSVVEPYLIDGWSLSLSEQKAYKNHHNWFGKNGVRVSLHRYVGEDNIKKIDVQDSETKSH